MIAFNCTKPFFGFVARDLFICGQVLRCEWNSDLIEIPIVHRGRHRLGFLTDFASKPWLTQVIVGDRIDEGAIAYVFHDWIYCYRRVLRLIGTRRVLVDVTRKYSDNFLHFACRSLGMDDRKTDAILAGVELGGGMVWNSHGALNLDAVTVENPGEDFAVLTARVIPDFDVVAA